MNKPQLPLRILDTRPLKAGTWPDVHTGLVFQATESLREFLENTMTVLPPMILAFHQDGDIPVMVVMIDSVGGDEFVTVFPRIVQGLSQQEEFLGAIMMAEGYVTPQATGIPAMGETVRMESLIQTLCERDGIFQVRATPFHRDEVPGSPIQDGWTVAEDGGVWLGSIQMKDGPRSA